MKQRTAQPPRTNWRPLARVGELRRRAVKLDEHADKLHRQADALRRMADELQDSTK